MRIGHCCRVLMGGGSCEDGLAYSAVGDRVCPAVGSVYRASAVPSSASTSSGGPPR